MRKDIKSELHYQAEHIKSFNLEQMILLECNYNYDSKITHIKNKKNYMSNNEFATENFNK